MLRPMVGAEKKICTGRLPFPDVAERALHTPRYAERMKLLLRWLLLAAALLLVAQLYSGVGVASFGAAMIAAFVIGLLNTLVRPVLILLTLPVTLLTLGLFLFVINALLFWTAALVLDGFQVRDFPAALLGSLLYSMFSLVIDSALERLFPQQ